MYNRLKKIKLNDTKTLNNQKRTKKVPNTMKKNQNNKHCLIITLNISDFN